MGKKLEAKKLEGETPFGMALKAVASIRPERALKIEQAISEGRLTIQDVVGPLNAERAIH